MVMSTEMTFYTSMFIYFVLAGVAIKIIFMIWSRYSEEAHKMTDEQMSSHKGVMKKVTGSLKAFGFVGALATLGGASPTRAVVLGLAIVGFILVTTWDR
jgi:TRAP-type C4-dicarboxylate transport system permease large subunit